jgi:hypothetical protein
MPKLPHVFIAESISCLQALGFEVLRRKGSHFFVNCTLFFIAIFLAVGCSHDPRCDQACTALRAVKPDKEGYLPRDKVLEAVGLTDSDFSSYASTYYGGYTNLDCGCFFEFAHRGQPKPLTRKTIEDIINNPNRTASATPQQLESAVIVRKHQEICRVESAARRRKRTALKASDAEFAK